MEFIQIGSMTISQKWIILAIAIAAGLFTVKIWLNKTQPKELHKNVFNLLTDSLFWVFITWKLSLIIFEPSLVLKSPLSVLYFTGGTKGLILAIILAISFFFVKSKKLKAPTNIATKTAIMFILISIITYQSIAFFLTENNDNDKPVASEGVGIQELAPDFELASVNGETVKLSDMRGKTVIVNFWATWCPPCKAEMPHMVDFYEEKKNNHVEILAVNLTPTEKSPKKINQFMKEYGITFPVLLDENGAVADTYQAITIPTTYVIDPSGKIVQKITGPVDKEKLIKLTTKVK